jgi:hypothetical protein
VSDNGKVKELDIGRMPVDRGGSINPRVIMKLRNINDYFIQLTYMNNLFFIRKTIFIIIYFLLL